MLHGLNFHSSLVCRYVVDIDDWKYGGSSYQSCQSAVPSIPLFLMKTGNIYHAYASVTSEQGLFRMHLWYHSGLIVLSSLKGLSFISNRQRRKEGTFCASGLAGIEPTPPAPVEQGMRPSPTRLTILRFFYLFLHTPYWLCSNLSLHYISTPPCPGSFFPIQCALLPTTDVPCSPLMCCCISKTPFVRISPAVTRRRF